MTIRFLMKQLGMLVIIMMVPTPVIPHYLTISGIVWCLQQAQWYQKKWYQRANVDHTWLDGWMEFIQQILVKMYGDKYVFTGVRVLAIEVQILRLLTVVTIMCTSSQAAHIVSTDIVLGLLYLMWVVEVMKHLSVMPVLREMVHHGVMEIVNGATTSVWQQEKKVPKTQNWED